METYAEEMFLFCNCMIRPLWSTSKPKTGGLTFIFQSLFHLWKESLGKSFCLNRVCQHT